MVSHPSEATNLTALSRWYRERGRDAFVRAGSPVIRELDVAFTKDGPSLTLPVCVVGVAGVGKSTLLNALLSDWMPLLPQGGVGSFTSTRIRIVHTSEPYLAVRRDPEVAPKLLAALAEPNERAERPLQEARLLVQGTQFGDGSREYLCEVLKAAAAGRVSDRAAISDRGRLSVLASVLTSSSPGQWRFWSASSELPALRHELENNAAGFLSPLASEVELGWSAPFLRNLQLVDLPGLGVVHDVLQQHTKSVLLGARSLLLVVDRSGIRNEVADAVLPVLSTFAADDTAAWTNIIVAITQLDQIASERRIQEQAAVRRSWQTHFDELGSAMTDLVRGQVTQLLAGAGMRGGSNRDGRAELAGRIRIVHVAPLEHRRFHRRDREEPPQLTSAAGSGLARLREELDAVGSTWMRAVTARLRDAIAEVSLRGRDLDDLDGTLVRASLDTREDGQTT